VSTIPQTPHEGWNAFNARKQKEGEDKKYTPTPEPDDNQPECSNLTSEEERLFENARQAVAKIKRTFETWMVIARGVEAARNRADRLKGKKVFERILTQQGIDGVLGKTPATVKSTATRLLKILAHEKEVMAWRGKLSDCERTQWASPTAVYRRCPVFQYQAERDGEKKAKTPKPSPAERIKELEVANAHLQEELSATIARYDASEPKPGKVKGLLDFYSAWKDLIDTVLWDTQALTPKERLEALEKLEDDVHNAKRRAEDELAFEAAEAPAPEPSPEPAALAEAAVKGEANTAGALGMTMH
jgi:hypothetical protein